MSNYIIKNDKVYFHPGYYLEEIIETGSYTAHEMAKKLDLSDQALHRLVNGRMTVDETLAGKLSQLTGTGAGYWLNLQKAYQSAENCA